VSICIGWCPYAARNATMMKKTVNCKLLLLQALAGGSIDFLFIFFITALECLFYIKDGMVEVYLSQGKVYKLHDHLHKKESKGFFRHFLVEKID
jgi:hypothetical protein